MHTNRRKKTALVSALVICICCLFAARQASAYNYLYVDQDTGTPIGWEPGTTITYYLDPGPLGNLTNDQAHTLLQAAMNIWESIPNANVPHFEFGGYLPEDVDGTNYEKYVTLFWCFMNDLASCTTDYQKNLQTIIVFDNDDYILRNQLCRIVPCVAKAGPGVFDGDFFHPGAFRQAQLVFGRNIVSTDTSDLVGTFVHEVGHSLGLAHPYLNQQLIGSTIEGIDIPSIFLPSMHTRYSTGAWATLNPDDIAGLQTLYPSVDAPAAFGAIHGKILKADGSPVAFANVIARNVEDPWCKAYSMLSSRRCDAPTPALCDEQGLSDGIFRIDSLPTGSYTIEVEGLSPTEDDYVFTVAPGITDAPFPGNAEFWNDGDSATEDPLSTTVITLAAGEIRENIDITLDDTQYHDGDAIMIPATSIPIVANTACTLDTTDWNSLAGIQAPSNTQAESTPTGGCSLIPRQRAPNAIQ